MGTITNAFLGGWEWSGTGRIQWQYYSMEGVKLVGMSLEELNNAFKIRIVKDPTTGLTTIYTMAQDIIDNTRRAFAISSTSATGYGSEGPPSGRYIAPGSSKGCVTLFPGDCGTAKQYLVLREAFHRTDMTIKKRFAFGRKASADLSFEVLNVFGDINFNQSLSLGGTWQVTSAYTDINTTYDPGGRIGQIVWRINW